jgi:hypothetical protein
MQGESIVPLLKEQNTWTRDAVYYHYYEYPAVHMVKRHYGIVTKEYKLVHFYYDVDEWELYDRTQDMLEVTNVINDSLYAEIVEDLKRRLLDLRVKYGDSDILDQQFIDIYRENGWIE